MSQTGDTSHDTAGYTLTELLVVLAIIAVMATAVPSVYRNAVPAAQLSHTHAEALSLLRHGRSLAINSGQEVRFRIMTDEISDEAGNQKLVLTRGLQAHYSPAFSQDGEGGNTSNSEISFYPDGSSSGGVLSFELDGRYREISIHWLFGSVNGS